ncbi:carboxypeptidase-like regulatory domain-containing protein [Pedobacter xixiisoli]|uniref:CarboxypepD_reg-like domain-containing protein n=1 Tax=Pedobacter xixiisoli TaxID=1476464 RepID=A0A286AD91_9SPHI|nr:carboxypeptidase-like regulatory domain-containing protein [Pedobacter xixiisoli]SOD19863.1 CarboxypepD_reg-like domain-containing protein [Pedobacter xixiisoli]
MKLRHLLFFLLLLNVNKIFSQAVIIKGTVSDRKSDLKLSGVTVRIGEQATRTNSNGNFELNVSLKTVNEKGINFSHVGYVSVNLLYQAEHFYKVILDENSTSLREVVVGVSGEDIIKKAIKKIPENYPDKATAIKGILRIQKWRNQSQYFKSDAVIQAHVPAYTSNEKTTVTVLSNQLDTLYDETLKYIRNISSYNLVRFADIAHNEDVIKKLLRKRKYDYRLVGKQFYNNHKVFVINSVLLDSNEKYRKLEATLYIDTASYAFVSANLIYYDIPKFGPFIGRKELAQRVVYEKIGKKWYLAEAHSKSIGTYKEEEPHSVVDFIRTELDTGEVKKAAYKDIVQNMDDIFLINKPTSSLGLDKNEKLFREAELAGKVEMTPMVKLDTIRKNNLAAKENYKKPFGRKVYDYIRGDNMRVQYGASKLPMETNSNIYSIPESINYGLTLGADYRFYKSMFVGFKSASNFWNKKKISLSTFALHLSNEFILNREARNITLTPYAGFQRNYIKFEKAEVKYNAFNYGLRASYDLTRTRALFISSDFNTASGVSTLNTLTVKQARHAFGLGIVIKR